MQPSELQCNKVCLGDEATYLCTGKDIEKQCSGIYPLQSVFVRKVKILRAPKFDVSKLMEVHGDYTEEVKPLNVCFCTACVGHLLVNSPCRLLL